MKIPLGKLAIASLLFGTAVCAYAQDYPKNPINLVIPVAPGDGFDVSSRVTSEEFSRLLKVPVLVVNRAGAGGVVAATSVVKSGNDGYTILLATNSSLTFRRVLEPQTTTYDPAKDLTSLGFAARSPSILVVRSEGPFRNFKDFVEFAKKNPGQVRVGTAGAGSIGDFCVRIINSLTEAGITMVPFKGSAPAVAAVRGGHVEGAVVSLGSVSGSLKSGAVKGIAISNRFPEYPDVPTLVELGYRQNLFGVWVAFFAPADVSPEVTRVLVPVIEKVMKDPVIASRLFPLGIMQEYMPPERVLAEIREEHRLVQDIAVKTGLVK